MNLIKKHLPTLSLCAAEIIIGILLLCNPVGFTRGIIIVAGIIVLALGIRTVLRYLRAKPEEAAKSTNLFVGLTALSLGAFCIFHQDWLIAAFPALAVLYGTGQILAGFQKTQIATDAWRMKNQLWYFPAIGAALSIILGMIIITNPGMTLMSAWVFTGIALIVEGIFDSVCLWFLKFKGV